MSRKSKNLLNYIVTLSSKANDRLKELKKKLKEMGFENVTDEPDLPVLYASIEADKAVDAEKKLRAQFGKELEVRPEISYQLPPPDSPIQ